MNLSPSNPLSPSDPLSPKNQSERSPKNQSERDSTRGIGNDPPIADGAPIDNGKGPGVRPRVEPRTEPRVLPSGSVSESRGRRRRRHKPIDRFAILTGISLCGLTAVALAVSPLKSPVAFVPLMVGIPTLFCGVVSLNPHRRRLGMGLAAGITAFGAVIGMSIAVTALVELWGGDWVNPANVGIVFAMTTICASFFTVWAAHFGRDLVRWWKVRR